MLGPPDVGLDRDRSPTASHEVFAKLESFLGLHRFSRPGTVFVNLPWIRLPRSLANLSNPRLDFGSPRDSALNDQTLTKTPRLSGGGQTNPLVLLNLQYG